MRAFQSAVASQNAVHMRTPARRVVRRKRGDAAPQTCAPLRSAAELRQLDCEFSLRPIDGSVPRSEIKKYVVRCCFCCANNGIFEKMSLFF
jgi:hypothetical protein